MSSSLASSTTVNNTIASEQFTRHRGPVTCACPIPNSPWVLSSAYDGAVALFNIDNHDVELLGYHAHLVNRVSVNTEGTLAASCSSDFNIHLWDLKTKQCIRVLRGHSDDVEDFIFIDENLGASVARDWRVLVWNLHTGAIEHTFLGHAQDVLSIGALNGKLYTSGDDMTLRIWDLEERKAIKTLGPFDTETDTCAIDPVNNRVVLGCDDGLIRIFDLQSGNLLKAIPAHNAGIKKVACANHNGDILSAAYDQRVLIWDAQTLELKNELEHKAGTWERSFNWSSDGIFVYAGTFDGSILQWNAQSGQCEQEFGKHQENADFAGNACFNDVATLSGDSIVAVSDDGLVRTGRLSKTEAVWQHIHMPESGRVLMNAVTSQCSSNKGTDIDTGSGANDEIITGTHEQAIMRFTSSTGSMKQTLNSNLQKGPINCIAVSQHDDYKGEYFVACYTGVILRVNRDGKVIAEINAHENAIKALALHPEKAIGVSCSAEGVLTSWDFEGNVLNNYPGHLAIIDDVDISANGELIASAGRDFTLKIHRLSDAKLLHNIGVEKRSPKALHFIGDDIVIVTNYWGELLRIDLREESVLCKKIAENGISGIAIRGNEILASSYDGGIYLVDAKSLETLNCLRSMTQRINSPAFML